MNSKEELHREKRFSIVIGRDESGSLAQVSLFEFATDQLLKDFESIGEAIQYCLAAEGGFDFQEDYDDSEEFDPVFRIKITPDTNTITISEDNHDYWFGDLSDIDAALEELFRRDCDWDLVFYDSLKHKSESESEPEDAARAYLRSLWILGNSPEEEDEDEDDESDSDFVELSPDNFNLAGSFKVKSGRTFIGDPSEIEDYLKKTPEENDVWTAFEGLNIFDFGDIASTEDKTGIVYVERNDEGRIVKALISFDGEFEDDLSTEDFVVGNWLLVNTGSLMVGDPSLLEDWDTNNGEEWNLEGKIGKFSYQGASATTIANDYGVLADGKSVVFNTGYGDGSYYVFFLIKDQSGESLDLNALEEAGYTNWLTGFACGVPPDCEISKVVIDFLTEVE